MTCFLVFLAASCKTEVPKKPQKLLLQPAGLITTTLSRSPGFVEWADAGGDLYLLRVFDQDTDGDGKVEGRVGEHGEPEGDTPRLVLVDRDGSKNVPNPVPGSLSSIIAIDELVATDSSSRFFVYQRGEELHLFDAQTRGSSILPDADVSPDLGNPCMKPRQASFDISGRWLGWMVAGNNYRIRDLKTGVEETLRAPGKLWRAEPTPFGWAAMKVVKPDERFPAEKTSCACSWCPRFARSIGRYGFEGRSSSVLVKGELVVPLERAFLPFGPSTLIDLKTLEVHRAEKQGSLVRQNLPQGCAVSGLAFGASSVALSCGDSQSLYFPETGAQLSIDDPIIASESPFELAEWSLGAKSFVGVRRQNRMFVATLNWETGAVDLGPEAERVGKPHGKWQLSDSNNELTLLSVSGSRVHGKGRPDPHIFGFRDEDGFALLDPSNATFAYVAAAKRVAGPCALNDGITEISPTIRVQCVER